MLSLSMGCFLRSGGARWLIGQGTQQLMAELAGIFKGIDHYLGHVHKDATGSDGGANASRTVNTFGGSAG